MKLSRRSYLIACLHWAGIVVGPVIAEDCFGLTPREPGNGNGIPSDKLAELRPWIDTAQDTTYFPYEDLTLFLFTKSETNLGGSPDSVAEPYYRKWFADIAGKYNLVFLHKPHPDIDRVTADFPTTYSFGPFRLRKDTILAISKECYMKKLGIAPRPGVHSKWTGKPGPNTGSRTSVNVKGVEVKEGASVIRIRVPPKNP